MKDLINLKEVIPFKWRVQSSNQWNATCVAYIDARQVQELLDSVCGPENWQSRYSEHKGNLFCEIAINCNNSWVWKSDCGTESNVEKEKGEASDAFKRAAVMWGIGRFLYSIKTIKLPVKEKDGKFLPFSSDSNSFVYGGNITKWCNLLVKKITTPIKDATKQAIINQIKRDLLTYDGGDLDDIKNQLNEAAKMKADSVDFLTGILSKLN